MRRLTLILVLALIIAVTGREVYDFLVTNAGIQYFSSEPRRLLYVLLLGIAGGLVALGISRLSPGSQRELKLTALGAFGTFLIAVLGLFAHHIISSASMVTEGRMWGSVVTAYALFLVLAGIVWLEFRHVWKQREVGRPTNGLSQ